LDCHAAVINGVNIGAADGFDWGRDAAALLIRATQSWQGVGEIALIKITKRGSLLFGDGGRALGDLLLVIVDLAAAVAEVAGGHGQQRGGDGADPL